MYHLMHNLPVLGTLGMAALLAGPLVRLPIDLGAWLLDGLARRVCGAESGQQSGPGFESPPCGPVAPARRAAHDRPPPRPGRRTGPRRLRRPIQGTARIAAEISFKTPCWVGDHGQSACFLGAWGPAERTMKTSVILVHS